MINAAGLKKLLLFLLIVISTAIGFSCNSQQPAKGISPVKIGETAPDFLLTDINGKNIALSSYRGKIILLEFWAAWCSPCRAAVPALVQMQERYRDKGFVVLSVSMDTGNDKVSMLSEFSREFSINYPVLLDDNKIARTYKVTSIPTSYIIDREGKVIDFYMGYVYDLEKKILKHLGSTL